jgi:dethiobiotin synthetase
VATALVRALAQRGVRVAGMKPVAAGIEAGERDNADVRALMHASNVDAPSALVNPYAFAESIAPHAAAACEGRAIDLTVLKDAYAQLAAKADAVIVEGAGGALVPLDRRHDMLDVAVAFRLPVLLVVGVRLGCINHALLSALAVRGRGLALAAWVATRIDPAMRAPQASVDALRERLAAPCIGDFASPAETAFDADALAALGLCERGRRAFDPC